MSDITNFDPVREINTSNLSRSPPKYTNESIQEKPFTPKNLNEQSSFKNRDRDTSRDNSYVKTEYTPIRNSQLSNRAQAPPKPTTTIPTTISSYTPISSSKVAQSTTPKSHLKRSGINYNPDYDIKELQHRYEMESKEIRDKYEQNIQSHMKMAQVIRELESELEAERSRSEQLEDRFNLVVRDLETEKRFHEELDVKYRQLIEELHRKDHYIDTLVFEGDAMKKDLTNINNDIINLKEENIKMESFFKQKLREGDEKYVATVRDLTGENNSLRK